MNTRSSRCFLFRVALLQIVVFGGCQNGDESPSATKAGSAEAVETKKSIPLRVVIVDDELLGKAIQQQWRQRSAGDLDLVFASESEFATKWATKDATESADVFVYPARWLGSLVERQIVANMPRRFATDESWSPSDVFPLLRSDETTWGKTTYAVPFGTAPFVLAYQVDRWANGDEPPQTWDEFTDWTKSIQPEGAVNQTTARFAAPMAEGWAGAVLLARAGAYVRQSGQVSTVFNFQDATPLIDQPPFVRALESLIDALGMNATSSLSWTPSDVQNQLISGDCDIGWTWMSAADSKSLTATESADKDRGSIAFAELPGSDSFYSFSNQSWLPHRNTASTRATFVGYHGRIGSVAKKSRRQYAAWNFLLQLTRDETAEEISATSRFTAPFRLSQTDSIAWWADKRLAPSAARSYAAAVKSSLTRRHAMLAVRLPGQSEYMQALDAAVRRAVSGELTASEALASAAESWQSITTRIGRDKQIAAYNRSLGIDP